MRPEKQIRRRFGALVSALLAVAGALGFWSGLARSQAGTGPRVTVLSLSGPVEPTVARYLGREIAAAGPREDVAVIVEIDTPGGLVDSMQAIVQTILGSDVPVITYVAPQGARSASAGLYIMYAAHVSAMAPATNTGSATPIQMGGSETPFGEPPGGGTDGEEAEDASSAPADLSNEASMRGKVIEDAVAYIRGLAALRGRNAEWAEKAVRPPSASVTAREALELGVIDLVAADRTALVQQLDGREVEVDGETVTLRTEGAEIIEIMPSRLERILSFFANPNVAAILLTLGTTGLIVEFWNPGSILPGAVGAISLMLAFYSFQILPFNALFLVLMGIGGILIILEAFSPTFGIAGLSGVGIFGAGLYFLFPGEIAVAPGLLVALVLGTTILLGASAFAFRQSRKSAPMTGEEGIVGSIGRVIQWDDERSAGTITAEGERWQAVGDAPLSPGDRIEVTAMDGLILTVVPAAQRPLPPHH